MGYMNMDQISKDDFAAMDDLFERFIPAHKEIYLFGTGGYGRAVYKYLSECGVSVAAFVVSRPQCEKTETGEPILSIEQFKARYEQTPGMGLILSIGHEFYDEVIPKLLFAGENVYILAEKYKKLAIARCSHKKKSLGFHIVDHCNFACYACYGGAPVAKEKFYDFNQFHCELERLKELFGDDVDSIGFSGGEPLLHPQLMEFIEAARSLFADCNNIHFVTNGLLLDKQDEIFWKRCATSKVRVYWTQYPINYKNPPSFLYAKAKKHGAWLSDMNLNTNDKIKESWLTPLSQKGSEKAYDFLFCPFHNNCISVKDGRIYACNRMRIAEHLESNFNVPFPIRGRDYIDIFRAKNADEIYSFLSRRPPFCDFCAIRARRSIGEFKQSKKERCEWLMDT
jgi:hypothetical protein